MAEPSTTGGCLCGGVRFELTRPAEAAGSAAPWEPIPDDGLERFDEGRAR